MLALFGAQPADLFAVAPHIEQRRGHLPVEGVVLRDAEVRERVHVPIAGPQLGRLAGPQRGFGLGLERHAGEADEEQDDADVDDVAAVAAAIARQQLQDRER